MQKTRSHGKNQLCFIEEYFCHDEQQVTNWKQFKDSSLSVHILSGCFLAADFTASLRNARKLKASSLK